MSSKLLRENAELFFHYGLDITNRTIYLGGSDPDNDCDVDAAVTENFLKAFHLLSSSSVEPIRILLNNCGGETQHGLAIYDAIRLSKSHVTIDVLGHCYSIAAWILQAGDTRRMSEHSSLMIHDGDGVVSGRVDEQRSWYKFYQEQDHKCRTILLERIREKHPEYPMSKLEKLLRTDTIFHPQQAVNIGLVDSILV